MKSGYFADFQRFTLFSLCVECFATLEAWIVGAALMVRGWPQFKSNLFLLKNSQKARNYIIYQQLAKN